MAGVTKNNSKNVSSGKAKLPWYVYHPMPSTPCPCLLQEELGQASLAAATDAIVQ